MLNYYEQFFLQYCRFSSKDLIATFDKRLGRNTKVINTFYKIFFLINSKKFSHKEKQDALGALAIQVNNYLTDGDVTIYSEMYKALACEKRDSLRKLISLKNLQTSLDNFNEAMSDFNKLHSNVLFKQGLIEFNNAVSHLFKGFYSSETNFEKNIIKACTHLHRGSLDYYKTLIKNKESLTHPQKIALVELRSLEMESVGLEVANSDKDEILIKYRHFARSLHGL